MSHDLVLTHGALFVIAGSVSNSTHNITHIAIQSSPDVHFPQSNNGYHFHVVDKHAWGMNIVAHISASVCSKEEPLSILCMYI